METGHYKKVTDDSEVVFTFVTRCYHSVLSFLDSKVGAMLLLSAKTSGMGAVTLKIFLLLPVNVWPNKESVLFNKS
jgi:hypothetical protein